MTTRGVAAACFCVAVVVGLGPACSSSSDSGGPSSADGGGDGATSDATASDAGGGTGGALGAACTTDDACGQGLVCFEQGTATQWPAHGLCTKKCSVDSECAAIVPGAVCAPFGDIDTKWCLEPCTLGPPGIPALNAGPLPGKCHGRADVGCTKFSDKGGVTACRPSCNDSSACDGASCDPSNGGCTTLAVGSWDDIGNFAPKPCSTHFVLGTGALAACTGTCVVGVVPTCGWSGPGTVAKAACLRGSAQTGQGDRGSCVRLCDTSCDCEGGFLCDRFNAGFQAETGRAGVCSDTAASPIPCGDGGADAGDGG